MDPSNIVWLDASNTTWINQPASPASAKGPKIAFLWGNPRAHPVSCKTDEGCIIYVRTKGKFDVVPAQPNK